jgi:HlyD family secretion protein
MDAVGIRPTTAKGRGTRLKPKVIIIRNRWLGWTFLVGAGIGMGLLVLLRPLAKPVPARSSSEGVIRPNRVAAWGRLAPQSDVIPLSAAANQLVACVEELLVAEGDPIELGQPIAILDSHARRKATVAEAEARVASAKAKLAAVQAGAKPEDLAVQQALIDAGMAELQDATEQWERGKSLLATRSISDEEHAMRTIRWRKATAVMSQLRSGLDSLKHPKAEDVHFAQSEVGSAEAALMVAQADLEQSIVRSPIVGQVLQVHVRPGQKIGEKGVVDIGDTRIMHAIAEVYEEDIGRITIGQSAEIYIPSLQRHLHGEVQRISRIVARKSVFSNDPVEDTDARVIEVRIALNAADSQLVSGLSNARLHVRIDAPGLPSTPEPTGAKDAMERESSR